MRKLATIRKIDAVKPIEGADFIEVVKLGGWQCVASKGEFQPGDFCVYFEIDSFLPIEERYEFLRKSSYRKLEELEGGRGEGFRLRSVKLRGELSQGLAMPLSKFPELDSVEEGDEVTEILKVEKWEPPIPASLAGEVRGMFPGFIPQTDEERIQNLPHYFEDHLDTDFEVTEKIDGSSMTVFKTADDFGVCSRGLDLKSSDKNSFWVKAKELKLQELMQEFGRNIALQGELAGEGIQKNRLKIKGHRFFVFNIWDMDMKRYLTPDERKDVIKWFKEKTPIDHVPVIQESMKVFQEHDMESLLEFADGNSEVNPKMRREGLVFKSRVVIGNQIISFKSISNKYLLKTGD